MFWKTCPIIYTLTYTLYLNLNLIIYIQDDQKCLMRLRGKQRDSETSTSNDINVGMKECRT